MRKSIGKNILYQCTCTVVLQVVNYSCLHNTKIKVPYSGIHTWIDLKTVITLVGIFKQAVHWIEHFVRKEKEPLSERKKITTPTVEFTTKTGYPLQFSIPITPLCKQSKAYLATPP